MKITELEPKQLWTNFANLNAVPRPSKKEEKETKDTYSHNDLFKLRAKVMKNPFFICYLNKNS